MKNSFKGGIHPPSSKELTKNINIVDLPASDMVIIPLRQHIGAPLNVCVNVGDYVKKGQILGTSDAFVSAPVHSSVSGKVVKIEPHIHPSGVYEQSVFIENDHEDNWWEEIKPLGDYKDLSSKEIIDAVRNAGIVGMGGASFPTHVKLSVPEGKKAEYLILNGAECEPYLTSDYRVMLEQPCDVIYGLKSLMKALNLEKGYIGIEDNKKDAIKLLNEITKDDDSVIIVPLKTKYPQGSEKHLIKSVTGRRVPSGKLPIDVGAIVVNIDTAVAVYKAIKFGTPLIERIVTVTGNGVNEPKNFRVKVGTPFSYVLDNAGGLKENTKKLIMGGPMMGMAQYDLDTPVVKGTSGLLALTEEECIDYEEMPCVKCGKCVDACPMGLMPLFLSSYSKQEDFANLNKYSIMDCIECGSCSYVCPSNKNPVEHIRLGKAKLRIEKEKGGNK